MNDVCGVRFKKAGKIYDFCYEQEGLKIGDHVIVETVRGVEYGEVMYVEKERKDTPYELKPVLRIANEDDEAQHEINISRKPYAMKICAEKIRKHSLPMNLVDMEYTFDANKVIFYFTAEGRVDFRELARDLASHFKIRIELRQIGVRDQTKMLGGLGACGRECCCKKHLSDFSPISITMAKHQGLSLNPVKISGLCGRLLCCLGYEDESYKDALKNMPKLGEVVITPDGEGVVVKQLVLAKKIRVKVNIKNEEVLQNYDKDDVKPTGKRMGFEEDLNREPDEEFDAKKLED